MEFGTTRMYTKQTSPTMYYIIMLASFVIGVKLMPFISKTVSTKGSNIYGREVITYLLSYVLAGFVTPEIGFALTRMLEK